MLTLPPTIHRLIFLFVLATPLLSIALPAVAAAAADPPSKLQPRAPQPSRRMGAQKRAKKVEPLKKKDYSSFLCPGGSVACPIPSSDDITPESAELLQSSLNSLADWFKIGFECIELATELNSCGGCLALGAGQDCSLISNAKATGCESGTCQVYSCFDGYVVSSDRQTCVKKGTMTPATPITAVGIDDPNQVVLS
ncbi:uncharacterized protein IL334_000912 [Kwoniella shivajii]|uniref:Protein CPL1-like domain-containing protein n=1 Tax=Kwoniella shivajii TaxID=564305 RepID=A0ABZ1CQH1_9TREE|nr:hypothetical protein IL334_000912 [Kwoniella shivajii]